MAVIDDETNTWSDKQQYMSKSHEIEALKNALAQLDQGRRISTSLTNVVVVAPPIPTMPNLRKEMSMSRKLELIQKYISSFEYNHTGRETTFSFPRKDRGTKHVVHLAKVIIREALPIQCVEAVFLAVHLTNGMKELLRIPVSFRSMSSADDEEHSHMILAIKYTPPRKRSSNIFSHNNNNSNKNDRMEAWGSLGISRLEKLMYKPLIYHSLSDLVSDFAVSYRDYHHELQEVSFGLPFPHDFLSEKAHEWRALKITSKESDHNVLDTTASKISQTRTADVWTQLYTEVLIRFSRDCTKMYS